MQTSDAHKCATPANWQPGDDVIVPPPGSCGVAKERIAKRRGGLPVPRLVPVPQEAAQGPVDSAMIRMRRQAEHAHMRIALPDRVAAASRVFGACRWFHRIRKTIGKLALAAATRTRIPCCEYRRWDRSDCSFFFAFFPPACYNPDSQKSTMPCDGEGTSCYVTECPQERIPTRTCRSYAGGSNGTA